MYVTDAIHAPFSGDRGNWTIKSGAQDASLSPSRRISPSPETLKRLARFTASMSPVKTAAERTQRLPTLKTLTKGDSQAEGKTAKLHGTTSPPEPAPAAGRSVNSRRTQDGPPASFFDQLPGAGARKNSKDMLTDIVLLLLLNTAQDSSAQASVGKLLLAPDCMRDMEKALPEHSHQT